MKIEYKNIKVFMPHCSKCKERLFGNGSVISPYECKCGEWKWDNEEQEHFIKDKKNN